MARFLLLFFSILSTIATSGCRAETIEFMFDCRSAVLSNRFSAIGYQFVVPAGFVPSSSDANSYVFTEIGLPLFGPGIEHDSLVISTGEVEADYFDQWETVLSANPEYKDIAAKSRTVQGEFGGTAYEAVLIRDSEYLRVTSMYKFDPFSILECILQ